MMTSLVAFNLLKGDYIKFLGTNVFYCLCMYTFEAIQLSFSSPFAQTALYTSSTIEILPIPNSQFPIKLIAPSNLELELKKKSRRFCN
ncbi:hypothetical protein [Microcoleus sp. Pol11C3]|uniref:hypothetical protein n=1 Tax=Microcoleus sp. Pol11C3 TaxID=3055390 RepID=UPI002FD3D2FF